MLLTQTTITKRFDFDAAHHLPKLPFNHKCRHMHGHTYRVDVICRGPLDERGFVVDYAEIVEAWEPIHELIDHKVLNDVEGLENPTTEVLAPWILERLATGSLSSVIVGVRVWESSTTNCYVELAGR